MMLPTSGRNDILSQRGRTNALKRYRAEDDPELVTARRDLAAASLAEHVRRVVEETPPMTAAQCDAIIAILYSEPGTT